MKFTSLKLSSLVAAGLLSLSLQAHAASCDVTDAIGKWGLSAQGVDVAAGGIPFAELGAFTIKSDGTGHGVVNYVMNGMFIPNIPVQIVSFSIDPKTCLGNGTVIIGSQPPKPHVFLLTNQGKEMHIIDASGNHTSLGIAMKQ